MKWFQCLNEEAPQFREYDRMIRVAVATAAKYTPLEPVLLFDGGSCPLTDWFASMGGTVVFAQSRLKADLLQLAEDTDNHGARVFGPGAYLRLEIPRICRERKWDDLRVLYTDCDIMFQPAFDLGKLPAFDTAIAVGPGPDVHNSRDWNTGVLFFNIESTLEIDTALLEFMRKDIPGAVKDTWDQYSMLRYFTEPETYTFLGPEWHWKAYWDPNPGAQILHFHGPKPFHRKHIGTPHCPEAYGPLLNKAFYDHCALWDCHLKQVES